MTPQLLAMLNSAIGAEELMRQIEMHETAQSHIMGLQGFKRFHRYNSMDRAKHSMMLRGHLTEYQHIEPEVMITYETPKQSGGMVESLKMMYDKSKAHIATLSTISKMAFDENEDLLGSYVMDLIEDESREAECYYRLWLNVKRENADLNQISKDLHKKYKAKERKYFAYEE